MDENLHNLAPETILQHYRIEKILSSGGFSIVYLAVDQTTKLYVVIKEYLPSKIAGRDANGQVCVLRPEDTERFNEGRKLFIHEANALRRFDHPTIVRVTNFFEANNTLYMVMDFKPGENLQSYIRKRHGNLSETFLLTIFPPLLDGLRMVHAASMLHLDIKPGNIHIQPGGDPILLDFGGVHRMKMSRQFQPRSVITEGFSPVEQYERNGYIGPWTDLYAIGATIRACIEGTSPPNAQKRREKDTLKPAVAAFKRKYSHAFLTAIDWAMEIDPELRPQSVDDLLAAFDMCMLESANKEEENAFSRFVGNLPWMR
jgi:serine/threonine protein kinase